MVYHYFGSKDALFEAALAEVDKRIEEIEFQAGAARAARSTRRDVCGRWLWRVVGPLPEIWCSPGVVL
jgi:AcrR family transcriptional regulator